jgi:hypothetical protein
MEKRSKDTYHQTLYEFIKNILVYCPKCNHKAIVKTNDFSFLNRKDNEIKLICSNCGFNKFLEETPESVLYSSKSESITGRQMIIGGPFDPFFQQPLWLTDSVGDNLLWAYNIDHLNFLKQHVEAKLRERNNYEYQNKSLGSRLPKWMTSKKSRDEIIHKIEKLINKN